MDIYKLAQKKWAKGSLLAGGSILFGFSLPCFVNILLLNGVFRKLDGDVDEDDDEADEKGSKFWKGFYRKSK